MSKRTNKEFIQEVYNLVEDNYEFLEEYKTAHVKIKCKHNTCGYTWSVNPNSFLRGTRCPSCYGNTRKTNNDFIQEVLDLVSGEYTFQDEYNGNHKSIRCKHNTCGYIWDVTPKNFLAGSRCPKCNGGIKKSNEEFRQDVYAIVGDAYEFLENYINTCTKIKCIHKECGYEWDITPANFLSGKRCPKCSGNIKKTNIDFIKEVYGLVGSEYEFLEEYIGANKKILCRHNKCNHEWKINPSNFLGGNRCPQCAGNKKKTLDGFKKEIYELVGDEYEVLGEYKRTIEHVKIKHNKCGYIYSVRANHFLFSGSRCPQCSKSKGEKRVKLYLKKQNIKYRTQYTFDDCRNKNVLQFDFYLQDYGLLIEYDGIQHFEPVDFAGKGEEWAKENFNYQQQNNNIKSQYCKDNNIPLLRIPYWDFDNIETIIDTEIIQNINQTKIA